MMNTFVTGGSGFVGGSLIQFLVKSGHGVSALVRSNTARGAVICLGAEPVEGDLADRKALGAGLEEMRRFPLGARNLSTREI
jgi:uncharacterized protein YbjT (DUF2867 family)